MTVYPDALATSDDYTAWTSTDAPPNIDQILRSCTQLVLNATKLSYYYVGDDGIATNTDVAAALRDATCIQASAWVSLKIDPLTGGVLTSSVKGSRKIGTASIDYGDTAQAVAARQMAYSGLVPEAARKLRLMNLLAFAPGRSRYGR